MPADKIQRVHVMTYFKPADDPEERLVAFRALDAPAQGQDGALLEADLAFTENYQCEGDPTAQGCTKLHGHARELVKARIMGDDGRVNVVWRRFHPKVAGGVAKPNEEFEHKADHGTLRVEVRELVDDPEEVFTKSKTSMVSIRAMQADWNASKAEHDVRMKLRSRLGVFQVTAFEAMKEQIDETVARLSELPNQKAVKEAQAKAEKFLEKMAAELAAELDGALKEHEDGGDAAAIEQTWQQDLQRATELLHDALEPFAKIEAAAADLLKIQDQVRELKETTLALPVTMAEAKKELPNLDVKAIKIDATVKKLDKMFERTREDGALDKQVEFEDAIKELGREVAELSKQGKNLRSAESMKKRAFDSKVAQLEEWRTNPESLVTDLSDFALAGGVFAGFGVQYWKERAEALGADLASKLKPLEDLSYHRKADVKKLNANQKLLGPADDLIKEMSEAMKACNNNIYNRVEIDGNSFAAPSARIRATQIDGDQISAQFDIRNNDEQPIELAIFSAGQQHQILSLGGGGRRATFELTNLTNPIHIVVTGVGTGEEQNNSVPACHLEVPSQPVLLVAEGADRHIPPYSYTAPVDADWQAGQKNIALERLRGAVFSTQMIPGVA